MNNTVGKRIKQLRKSEELTQKDFSKRLLISQSYLSGLENGNEMPTEKLMKLICLEFGINSRWLTDGSGEMYSEVYENDKVGLVEISNSALLKIMTLLSTKSNVEYGLYANILDLFTNILKCRYIQDEEQKLQYLDFIQTFIMDFERMLYVLFSDFGCSQENIEKHDVEIYRDLERIVSCIKDVKSEIE